MEAYGPIISAVTFGDAMNKGTTPLSRTHISQ
jgi:hypothetical protein